jgi:hypothetical protein
MNIANCDLYRVDLNSAGTETVECGACKGGYGPSSDGKSCTAVTAATQKENCKYTKADGFCLTCKSGFRFVSDLCVPYIFKGCGSGTTKCEGCDVGNNYFNVDVGLDDSKVCKSYEMILKVSALVLAFMTLF